MYPWFEAEKLSDWETWAPGPPGTLVAVALFRHRSSRKTLFFPLCSHTSSQVAIGNAAFLAESRNPRAAPGRSLGGRLALGIAYSGLAWAKVWRLCVCVCVCRSRLFPFQPSGLPCLGPVWKQIRLFDVSWFKWSFWSLLSISSPFSVRLSSGPSYGLICLPYLNSALDYCQLGNSYVVNHVGTLKSRVTSGSIPQTFCTREE